MSKRRMAWVRYLLVFFVAAWMFVLGVLVGRGTAPVHFDIQALQKELAGLRDAMVKKERDAVEKAIQGKNQKAPLEFYEALKKDGPDTTMQIPEAPTSTGGPSAPEKTTEAVKPSHKSRPAIMAKKSILPDKPKAGKNPSAKPVESGTRGHLTIQVASLKDGAAAERIVANLKKGGYPAYLSRNYISGKGLWFRVRVGSYKDRKEAASDLNRLTRAHRKPIIMKR